MFHYPDKIYFATLVRNIYQKPHKLTDMLKVNVERELDSKSSKDAKDDEIVLDQTKLLLEGDFNKERDLLKQIGLGHHIAKAEDKRGKILEKRRLENQYEGKVYTTDEIKELCLDYNLRLLQSEHYKGHIDMEIGVKLRNFYEKNGLKDFNKDEFYIMAPGKAFNLQDNPLPPQPIDPILFYKTDANHYTLVHRWGNEFTIFRLISGFAWRTAKHAFLTRIALFSSSLYVVLSFILKYGIVGDVVLSVAIGSILAALSMLVYPMYKENTDFNE